MSRHFRPRPYRALGIGAAVIGGGIVIVALIVALVAVGVKGGTNHPVAVADPTTTTTTVPARQTAESTWTAIENAKPGTPDWTVSRPSTSGQIEGFLDRVSAQQGEAVNLSVTSTAPTWTATAYRMGWYGGVLARRVWSSGPQPGVAQPPPSRDPKTNMVETSWSPSLQVLITPDWPPGDYLFKLVASTGWDSYVPLTVRDDRSHSPILIINSVTTWQAYNLWGGYDLYSGPPVFSRRRGEVGISRSTVVSFDRPYQLGDGAGDFLGNEEKLVKLVEKEGLDVSYTTDIDLHEHPELLLQHRVVVSLGHDEYYSTAMRDGLEAARDKGVNLLFLGANAVYRHIRLEPSPLGPNRHEINYRVAGIDPLLGVTDSEVTVSWRDPPVARPESSLLGAMYQCNPVLADLVVTDPTAWVYAGTQLEAGQHLKGLVGSEYDHYTPGAPAPPVELLARSPVVCRGIRSTSDFTYYVAATGAGVIDTGTNLWVPKILDDPAVGAVVAQITLTMLRQASAGPLGHQHPAHLTSAGAQPGSPAPPTGE